MALVGPDELAELRAPVANVVVANHLGAAEGQQTADGLADDGRAQVADVHLLGGVRGRIIDQPGLAAAGTGGSGLQVLLRVIGLQPAEQGGRLEAEVQESRTRERQIENFCQRAQLVHDLLGQGPRVLLFLLGKGQGSIGLEIAIGRIRHPDLGLEAFFHPTEPAGGCPQGGIEVTRDVERKVHRLIEELRLALSKNDFCGWNRGGSLRLKDLQRRHENRRRL